MPSSSELESDTQRAVQILQLFTNPSNGRDVQMLIPPSVLRNAHGIVLIRLIRVGLMISAKSGTGIIIARLPDGSWSAPSGVSISSLGFGHQAGGEVIDSVIVMNYRAAVKAFFDGGGQLQLGVNASLAAGPYGRAAEVAASASSATHIAATYSYSSSKGLYAGYSMEGSKISERVNTNRTFYGRPITAREILTGDVPPPAIAAPIYQILESLGAGPRPGLPFAPKKSFPGQGPPPPSRPNSFGSYQQQHYPPPLPTTTRPNVPSHMKQEFEEPPPPYSENANGSSSKATAAVIAAPSTNPYLPSSSSISKPPIVSSPPLNNTTYNATNNYYNSSPQQQQQQQQKDIKGKQQSHEIPNQYSSPIPAISPYNGGSSSSSNNIKQDYPYQQQQQQPPFNNDSKKKPIEEEEQMTVVVAKYDYHGAPNDLSFSAGDTIIVTRRLGNRESWWEGEIGDKRGFFPANYTEDFV